MITLRDYLEYNIVNMDIRERLKMALEREDVQGFLTKREGVCNACKEPVALEDDGEVLHILSWVVLPKGRVLSLDEYRGHSHHLAPRTTPKVCQGHVPVREEWTNSESGQYDADFAAYIALVQDIGIVNRNGRWVLGDTIEDNQQ